MKRYMDGSDLWITEYNSIGEFINDINSLPNNQFFQNRHSSQRKERSGGTWYATEDYKRATTLIQQGWESEATKMSQKVKMTQGSSSLVRHSKPTYGVVGSQASVPRYLQGIPTNMVSRQTTYSKQKVVTITKDISYNAGWTSKQILEECVKALQIIQSMENGGQRVRLNVMFAVTDTKSLTYNHICKVCVKQPDERMNISKMSFPLAHPSMLRRFFLKWMEVDPFAEHDMGDWYGTPASLAVKQRGMAENEYYIPERIVNMDELVKQLSSGKPEKR